MTETQKEQEEAATLASKFAMTEEDDFLAENEEHVHLPGCCTCHSNVGK